MITPFQKIVIKLLVAIYNSVRDGRNGVLFIDGHGDVYDHKTGQKWGETKHPWDE